MKPLILINFKTYFEDSEEKAEKLAGIIAQIINKKYELGIAPSLLDLEIISKKYGKKIKVYAQHVDAVETGAHTGAVVPEEVKSAGVVGTILNHSERKLTFNILKKTVLLCQKNKLKMIICASDLNEVKKVVRLKPDYLAYEPKELIGGNISVTSAKPKIILEVVKAVKKISPTTRVLCGAGVHSREDLQTALKLGASGVLLAHAVVKAEEPRKVLRMMLN